MDDSGRQPWLGMAILAGALYAAVGIILAALAGAAGSHQMLLFWRLSAWVISAVVFAAHIAQEHFRLHNAARPTALHVSAGVALGGFLLALAANIHDLWSASGYRPRMLIALVAWPLLTAVPAFIVALVVAAGLGEWLRAKPSKS
jgi:uncharacterized membrane protein YhaH (DUF805 family)